MRFHGLASILAQTLLHMDNPVLYPVFLIWYFSFITPVSSSTVLPTDAQQLNFVPFMQGGKRKYSSMFALVFSIHQQINPREFPHNYRRKAAVQKRLTGRKKG